METDVRTTIEQALTKLLELEEQKLDLVQPYQSDIETIQSTIAYKVKYITACMYEATYVVDKEIERLTHEIEAQGVAVGATVKVQGEHGSISSVYYKPSWKWEKAKLIGFAAAHPELMTIAEEVPASVQIRHGK